MMRHSISSLTGLRKHGRHIALLGLLLGISIAPTMEAKAMELNQTNGTQREGRRLLPWIPRTDFTQEEFDEYTIAIVTFIKKKKGWNPGEYDIQLIIGLADAPLVFFNVAHYDAVRELKKNPPHGFGSHPLEIQVFIQTEEMRVFEDFREFDRIHEEYVKKTRK